LAKLEREKTSLKRILGFKEIDFKDCPNELNSSKTAASCKDLSDLTIKLLFKIVNLTPKKDLFSLSDSG